MKRTSNFYLSVLAICMFMIAVEGQNSYLSAQNNKQVATENQKNKKQDNKKDKHQETFQSNKNKSSNQKQKSNVKSSSQKQVEKKKSNSPDQKKGNVTPVVAKKPQDLIAGFWYGGVRKSGAIPVVEVFEHKGRYYGVAFTSRNEKVDDSWLLDTENPDPKLRNRRRGNIIFIKDIRYNSDRSIWEGGTFYDSDTGKTYNINFIELTGNHKTLIFHLRGKKIEWAYAPNPEKFLNKKLPKNVLIKAI